MGKVRTLRIGNKLIIMNGVDNLMYVDLTTKKTHQYQEPLKLKVSVKAAIRDYHNGKQRTKESTFNITLQPNRQKTAFLHTNISARGKDYVDVKVELQND